MPISCQEDYNAELLEPQIKLLDGPPYSTRFYKTSSKSYGDVRTFSSHAGAKSTGKEDDGLEDGFSELEDENDDLTSASESDVEGATDGGLDAIDTVNGAAKKSSRISAISSLTKAVLGAGPDQSVVEALEKWLEDGNEVTEAEVALTLLQLRRRHLYHKALQLLEKVASNKQFDFVENHYASHLDLIAKVRGTFKAEEYLKQIPESFRGELVYRTLLANYVSRMDTKKAEDTFNKMRDLGFSISLFSYNQLLLLYKRTDKKKIADVLLLMEKEAIKPSLFTYHVLIDVKGQSRDISGMEQIVETMKADGVKPQNQIQSSLARHYAAANLNEKAESILKEMEEAAAARKSRQVYKFLLPIYASLGREDEVDRIWKLCESDPQLEECLAAVEAWGQLDKVEKAESAFEEMLKKVKKPNSRQFSIMLKVYANHKMLAKGKDLVKKMEESGTKVGPQTWDAVVKLFVGVGEVEKAATILENAINKKQGKLMFSSYLVIMDKFAERGDVHNTEKIFLMSRNAGYGSRIRTYQTLLQAYINAKTPAYGISDRIKADNLFPNRAVAAQLAKVNPFKKKSPVAELLQ